MDDAQQDHWNLLKQPVGKGEYTVGAGECISKIAYKHGHFWQTIWNHPDNESLKNERKDPNVLISGDRLTIPPAELGGLDAATEQRHRFKLKGVPAKFRIRLMAGGSPRSGESYELVIDGRVSVGNLGDKGELEISLPPDAASGVLRVGQLKDEIPLDFCGIDPIDTVSGIQQRLANLGYYVAVTAGEVDETTKDALVEFQQSSGLNPTGQPDQTTLDKLADTYGC